MKRCPKCGSRIRTNSAYCENCGVRLFRGKFLKQPKRKSNKNLWILAALVAVCILGSIIVLLKPFQKETHPVTVANAEEAINLLKEMGQEYGLKNGLSELTEKYTTQIDGDSYYRLQQNYQGIPVYGRTAVCATDASGQVTSVTGNVIDVAEDICMIPTVSKDQIVESIQMYLTNHLGVKDADSLEISEPSDENICIYNMGDQNEAHLAYCMNVGALEIVVDAVNGNVLRYSPTVYSANENSTITSANGYMASDKMRKDGFSIAKCTDTYYIMKDISRNLAVYTLDGNLFKENDLLWPGRGTLVESSDEIFGNTKNEIALAYETGAQLLINVAQIHDYFGQLGFGASGEMTNLYYNDGYDHGENALGGYGDLYDNGEKYGIISIGAVTGVNDYDVVSHEFTHRVSRQLIGFCGDSMQTGSINEGLSDIFGELLEALIFRKADAPDWVMSGDNISVRRNIANPRETGNMEMASDEYDGNNFNYAYSTVISHAAYLMWNGIDGSNSKKISVENLGKLWYRAMLMMPADCDFTTCRKVVEWAALTVDGLTDAHRTCIAEAFDTVGIYKPEVSPEILISCDYNAKPNCVLKVFNTSGELHPRYTLSIAGTIAEHELAYSTHILTDIGYRYEKTVEVKEATSYKLNLPDGYYTLTVSDRHNPQHTYSFTVSISDKGTDGIIGLYTDFKDQLIVQVTEETKQSEGTTTVDKQLTQINAYIGDDSCQQISLTYSNEGLLTSYTQDSYSSDREIHYSYGYSYNEEGRLVFSQEMTSGNNCSKFYYGDTGRLTSWSYQEFPTSDEVVYSCEYNSSGQRVRDISIDGNNENRFVYDDQGRVVSEFRRFRYGDMSGTSETTISYGDNGLPVEKKTISDWGMGAPTEEVYSYNYEYNPFVIVTKDSDGNRMYCSLIYEDAIAGEIISLTVDETASFEMKDGYLTEVKGADYTYDIFYDGTTDESFASRIPAPRYEDELT